MDSDIHKKGFSLIELLVVCVVILGITGIAISNYSSFTANQKLKQAGRTLKNNLRFVQTRAASGLKPPSCQNNNPLISYRVDFSETTYTYSPVCFSGIPANTSMSFSLPSGVRFSPVPSPFEFRVLTGVATRTETIVIENFGRLYSIQVMDNGNIEDLGFQ